MKTKESGPQGPRPRTRSRTSVRYCRRGRRKAAAIASRMRPSPRRVRQGTPFLTLRTPSAIDMGTHYMAEEVDEVVCLSIPEPFIAVGLGYEDFSQLDDQQVRDLLEMGAGTGGAHLGSDHIQLR